MDWIEQYLRLPPENEFCHGVRNEYVNGRRTHRAHLAAAWVQGDSMADRDICSGDVILFQGAAENGKIVVVEKTAEDER